MTNQILMIHEVCEDIFKIKNLEDYILTFDDALLTQYLFLEEFIKINTTKIFFISTNIIANDTDQQSREFIKCDEAHNRFFNTGDRSNYMNWSQVREIHNTPRCIIGGHGHSHKLTDSTCYEYIVKDTNKMLQQFDDKLKYKPDRFCFPYNISTKVYESFLKLKGFKHLYGANRLDWIQLL